MADDVISNRHSHVLAFDYNLAPHATKSERAIQPETDRNTMWLANTSGTVRCLIRYYALAKSITGTLTPRVTGTYVLKGNHNNKQYYQRPDEAWFLWWDGVDTWNVSSALGVQGDDFWTRTDPDIEGDYAPGGTAEGTLTVETPDL